MATRTDAQLGGTLGTSQPATWRRFGAWAVERRLHVAAAALFVVVLFLYQTLPGIRSTHYHPDESRWLNRADYTANLLQPFSDAWNDRYLTRGQPPGGSYVMGLGLLLQGRDVDTNAAWDFRYGNLEGHVINIVWNAARGAMPAWEDLQAARRTSLFLGLVSVLCAFGITTRITNVAGGLVAGSFLAFHPLNVYLSTLGVSDAAFTTFVALSIVAGMLLAAKPTWPRAVLLGVMLGAGTSTKLSPIFLAVALGGAGFVLVIEPWLRKIRPLRWLLNLVPGAGTAASRQLGWMLLPQPMIAGLFFFVTYPFLWPSPFARTYSLFQFRRDEMGNQMRIWPQWAVEGRPEALHRTWTMLTEHFSATGDLFQQAASWFGWHISDNGIDVPLAVAGLFLLVVLAWKRGITSPTFAAMIVAGGQGALILGGLKINFNRYYLPIVFIFALGVGVLAGVLCWWAADLIAGRRHLRLPRRRPRQAAVASASVADASTGSPV